MKSIIKTFWPALALLLAAAAAAIGQDGAKSAPTIDAALRAETIDNVLRLLADKYAYPEIALKMETAIRAEQKSGAYDSIADGNLLAERLTADLRRVFDDKHLKISFSAEPIPLRSSVSGAPTEAEIEAARARQRRENFGLRKVEILKGNVGLVVLNYFAPLDWSADVYAAALNAVANTDALIIDVRENGGSMDIDTIPFFCSYFFEKPVRIGDMYLRETGETRQLWTSARVPGRKYLNKPIYVLTSGRTASGAEAFVGRLKALKRAVLVGETTAGATMPGGTHRVNRHFSIWISTGRAASGTAQSENKGVEPDFAATREKAFADAYRRALGELRQAANDEAWKKELETAAAALGGQ